jgi:hypothetical protein
MRGGWVYAPDASLDRYAVSDVCGRSSYYRGYGELDRLDPEGNSTIETVTIDSLALKNPVHIRLHVEGGELNALRGARETLLRCRPIVSANVDHNEDGLWKIQAYLMDTLDDYMFLFRNHCWCGVGAVIYAIPNERWSSSC